MTTIITYNRQTIIDYDSLEFNPEEPEPLPDAMIQNPVLHEILSILADRFSTNSPQPDVFLDSNTFICYDRANLNVRVGPDVYIAFGVDAKAIRERRLYLPWEAGKPPDFVLEVASERTARVDVMEKRHIYAQIGVPEYWRFDPTGGEHYGQPLAGEQLIGGEYQPISLTTDLDSVLKGYSPALKLFLCWRDEWLYLYDPETGANLRNLSQEREARQAEQAAHQDTTAALQSEREARLRSEAALQSEREARLRSEATLQAEREAREADQTRIRRLEEELRRRRPEY